MRARPVTAFADTRSARAQAQAQAQALREELKTGNAFALLSSQTLRSVAAGGSGSLAATATASALAATAGAGGGTGFFGLGGSLPGLASTLAAAAAAPLGAGATAATTATAARPGSAAARTHSHGRGLGLGETTHAAPAGASEPLGGVSAALLTHAEVAARAARREWPAVLFRPLAALLSSVGTTEVELAEWLAHPARGSLAFPSARDVDEVDAREAARARREEEEARAGDD